MFLADDVFDLCQPRLVEIEQLVVRNLLLLQLADHVVIVARLPAAMRGYHARDRRHFLASLHIAQKSAIDQLARIHLHAEAFEIVGVDFRRETVGLACLGHDGLANPIAVASQLLLERREVFLPALLAAARQQIARSLDETILVLQVLLDFDDPGLRERCLAHALFDSRASEHGDGFVAALGAGITLEASQRHSLLLFRHAIVKKILEAAIYGFSDTEIRKHQSIAQRDRIGLLLGGGDDDVDVLLQARIGGAAACLLELRDGCVDIGLLSLD